MSAEEKFKLEPDGMFVAKMFAVVVIVLQADLGEFARIKSQVWRNARALAAEDVLRIESAGVSINPFPPKTGNPSRLETPKQLRIEAPVAESLGRQSRRHIFASLKALIERLGLQ